MRVRGWASAAALVGVALALTLALSACGGEGEASGGDEVASLGGSSDGDGASNGSGGDAESQREGALEFAECMRKHGIDHPDPDENGMFEITPESQARLDPTSSEFREAAEACQKHLGEMGAPPKLSPEERERMQEQMLAFARCMREQGIDMPDPQFGDEGGAFSFQRGSEADPSNPRFREAEEACREHSPELNPPGNGE
jgi:hypothetical protein